MKVKCFVCEWLTPYMVSHSFCPIVVPIDASALEILAGLTQVCFFIGNLPSLLLRHLYNVTFSSSQLPCSHCHSSWFLDETFFSSCVMNIHILIFFLLFTCIKEHYQCVILKVFSCSIFLFFSPFFSGHFTCFFIWYLQVNYCYYYVSLLHWSLRQIITYAARFSSATQHRFCIGLISWQCFSSNETYALRLIVGRDKARTGTMVKV